MGGTHFRSYDGHSFDFNMGGCRYVLSQVCDEEESHPTVIIQQGQLYLRLHGVNLSLEMEHLGKVKINGVLWTPPVKLDHMAILHFGLLTRVVIDTGVVVTYGGPNLIQIVIPASHKKMCGLCGITGEMSWAEGCSQQCNCSATATVFCEPASCPEGERCTLNDTWGCSRKADNDTVCKNGETCGVHSQPHQTPCWVLGGAHFYTFDGKVFEFHGNCTYTLIQTLNTTMSCPLNSHYKSCGTACPATCQDPFRSRPCTLTCVETCQCDPGFVLDGNNCVLLSQCGCTHNGYNYHSNQTFWADEECTEQCICDPHTHQTHCHLDSCGPDEYCSLQNGVRSCVLHHQQTCMYTGHHIVTFDQHDYDLHGTCQYQLVGVCEQKQGLDGIQVYIQTDGHLESALYILVNVSGVLVKLSSKNTENIEVDGVKRNMPYRFSPTALAFSLGLHTYIYTDVGFEFSLSVEGIVSISLSTKYANATCGLCGNFNSDPADDLPANKTQEQLSPERFGKAWRRGQNSWCCLGGSCPKCSSENQARFSDPEACGKILEVNGPFRHCHGKVDPSSFYKRCVSDLCLHGGLQPALCHSLAAYTAVCLSHKAIVYAWRNPEFCYPSCPSSTRYNMSSASVHLCLGCQNNTVEVPLNTGEDCFCEAAYQCPQFSHYSQCANACSSLCPEISQTVQCPWDCEEGCQCNTGHLYDGHACVPAEQCGCVQDGRRFKASESKLLQNCTVNCTCGPPLVCEQYSCPSLYSCIVSDGVMGCHKDAEQNTDPCEGKCDETENCYLSNGVPVCESRHGLCGAWGGQHYHTFDGLDYNFEGTCTYLLAASKGAVNCLTPFSVSKKNDCNGSRAAFSTLVVTVQAYGFIIKFSSDKGSIHVNGQVTYIPVNLMRGKIQVSYKGGKALLKTDFGMHVVFDGNSTVVVTLDPHYKGKVYGLCGNFNGDPQDEYPVTTPGSPPIKTSVELAQAYLLFDGDLDCCTGCKQNLDEETLPIDLVSDADSSKRCAVLTDQNGPWAHCHSRVNPDSFYKSCVVDRLHNGGSNVAHHKAIHTYSMVCGESDSYHDEVTVDVHCPPNSHYKTCGSACPPSCEFNATTCNKACVQGCFCNPGFIRSPTGCVHPHQCGCTDSRGKYHSLNSTFWAPDNCGQVCICGPAIGETRCHPAQCPRGMVCKQLHHKRLIVYNNIGTLMVILPSSYGSSVSGLCGNANTDPDDDLMMPNEELAQNGLEFAHSWRAQDAESCRSNCSFKLKRCPVEAQKLFEGSDFCGVLLNELGPFADCASVLSPKHYFHSCVADSCSYDGHYSAVCSSIASYAAACQAAQLPVRQWRSDTFCGMSCPKNSHYELCGPRCPVVCLGLSSPANCSGRCEEGCQCDPGYVLSDGQCVLVSDCGCMHNGQYHPVGPFTSEKRCQKCNCEGGAVTCSPSENCPVKDGLSLLYGVCQVFAGFGYIHV
ncbi:IgGFc-binding protein Fcgamma-binding protein antigen [Larimichthys crocea]|uniref:IgGFc-binding protein Fcgamma-binding protein antigen n=1 Tax=Larimichthys crocea TaxID=215358 RepID=A0A6G0IB04_LARCR|nr:IgGFc-binding protein Fcgamma-binding protein antigen [Larimichthys crocea]